ncbi:MFS transporter [Staphylococcus schweitzeri]|uniref:MFS transporter n=1 Tax=Staphylococcus schweitzeri TaxID=1654388 RepID=A0A2K4AKM4_9STAP|nr:MFS transporter [Staphylococcus schweitzeri]MBE2129693.1 MFS transporter [Staphylococcus schweitzeri]PNZ50294.1 MFS transporter [Staphylococcus schweitzeri]CDR55061.1 Macrolide-efflux protein [Staphylococcus schweitzeri]CDR67076.1 Macrolide-efflux protein [Staphylococcus schweitzeri]VEE66629.1 enterobactin exporter EntS [Staphylococcus schweitzeri]
MTKYFFSSSFLLFLGNWIGQIGLNWFVLTTYHNAVYLGIVNFCRLVPILLLSVWAGTIADKYDKGRLLRITITSSFMVTAILCALTYTFTAVPIIVIIIYATLRGILSAIETPLRQAILPDLSEKMSTTQAVSFHSFIINICRSIGPAIAGVILAVYHAPTTFLAQSICYLIAVLLCLPLHFKVTKIPEETSRCMALKVIIDYFKIHMEGRQIFITSLLIMATGFSYTTLLPVLTNKVFPGKSEIFGIAMTMCAIGGIVATLILPKVLKYIEMVNMYYLSSLLFGFALLGVVFHNIVIMFVCITLIGLFSQWARTTNRVYFQNNVKDYERGKVLSIIMMDRGMIPLGSLLMSICADIFGIVRTFTIMGISTICITLVFYIINRKLKLKLEESKHGIS